MDEFAPDMISLIDDEDNEVNFEIIDSLDDNGEHYLALLPIYDSPEESIEESAEFIIMKSEEEDGEEVYVAIGDDDLNFTHLADMFERRIEAMLDMEDDDLQ